MAYVTISNFEELLPVIEKAIQEASFISFDMEFTGLYASANLKPSLFDTIEERYSKMNSSVCQFSPCQFGLSLFSNEKEENKYRVQTFIFYIRSHFIGSIDHCFSFQSSCLQFLCDHEFNFNKFAFESIPYLNNEEEIQLRSDLSNQSQALFRNINESALQNQCSPISSWLITAQEGEEIELKKHKELQDFICINELNRKFDSIRAVLKDNDTIVVKKITPKEKIKTKNHIEYEENKTLLRFLGFTRIFRALVDAKKPMVGHNLMLDLLFLYHHFYAPLPNKYSEFKKNIHLLFPIIFDTKHIILSLRKEYEKLFSDSVRSLSELYNTFKSPKIKLHTLFSPHIYQVDGCEFIGKPHEAGYDAYASGYVFIQTAHILVMKTKDVGYAQPLSWNEHLKGIQQFKNRINIIRGRTLYMNLEGPDPPSHCPPLLYVQVRNSSAILQPIWVATQFSSYGCVDVMSISRNSALVAVGNIWCAKDILTAYHRHPDILVTWYNVFFHSKPTRLLLWCACFLSGSLGLILLAKIWKLSR